MDPVEQSATAGEGLELEARSRWRLWLAVAAGVFAVALVFFVTRSRAPAGPGYQTARVDRGPLSARVTASGTLSALVTVQIGSQVSGRLSEINVDFNSPVRKGQVIARIDPALYEAALEQARANALAAEANVEKAKAQADQSGRDLTRAAGLRRKGLISAAELQTARSTDRVNQAQLRAERASLEQARAALHQAKVNLGYTRIVSPINGVVISRSVDVGQTVAASLQAPTLFTLAEDMRRMQVDTSVAEADVGRLQPGMKATFTVDAFPSERFFGTIRQIRNAATTVQNVVTYDAVIDVSNPKLELRPGMTANVTVVYAREQDALRVPNAALRFRPVAPPGEGAPAGRGGARGPGGAGVGGAGEGTPDQKTVYVLRGGEAKPLQVKVGITDGSHTGIVSGGLREGDAVITGMAGGGGANAAARRPSPLRF